MNKFEFEKKALSYIENHNLISDGDSVVVGLSGGADSVCLLLLLKKLSGGKAAGGINIRLSTVHVEHGIRGEEALDDERFCEDLCDRLGVEYTAVHCDVPAVADAAGMGLEEAARKVRYEEYEKISKETGDAVIALAHHGDDQAETVLFNLIRGAGVRGLSGMAPKRDIYIRPLLWADKSDIMEYVRDCGETWVTDSTNSDDAYSRNKLRLSVIPKLCEINSNAVCNINNASDVLRDVRAHFEAYSQEFCDKYIQDSGSGETAVDAGELSGLDKAMKEYCISRILSRVLKSEKDIGKNNIDAICSLLEAQSGSAVCLPRNTVAYKEGERIIFAAGDAAGAHKGKEASLPLGGGEDSADDGCLSVEIDINTLPVTCEFAGGRYTFSSPDNFSKNEINSAARCTKYVNCDKITGSISLRYPVISDRIVVDEKGSGKKLGRFLMDRKVPSSQRSLVPVISNGSDIILVLGDIGRMGYAYRVDDNTGKIIRIDIVRD